MLGDRSGEHLKLLRQAEEAANREDYEEAARFYRYVAVHFGLLKESESMKAFMIKTGECYLNAARRLWDKNRPVHALLSFINASRCFKEGRDEERARKSDLTVECYYGRIRKDGTLRLHGDANDLKRIGDYFVNRDLNKAIECYEAAAERAFALGKLHLSGSLYATLGECYMAIGRHGEAAERYARSGDMYLKCRELFEAAWRYCISSFNFILAGDTRKALSAALKAEFVCREEGINVFLNDLASVCRLLSEGFPDEALRKWRKIRRKFKESYVKIIDSCFQLIDSSKRESR